VEGLRTLDPDAPQPFETAVEAGKLMTRSEAGKLGGRGNKAGGHAHELSRGKGMREYTLARLRRDDPELAARVERGELTANAAAVDKGWRQPRTPYGDMLSGWKRANEPDRARFMDFIDGWHREQEEAA
jgi:hypothetical protein